MTPNTNTVFSYARLIYAHTRLITRTSRFIVRSLIWWHPTITWLHFIESRPYLRQSPDFVRRVLCDKIHRPFARCQMKVSDRVDLLTTHYGQMEKLFPEPTILTLVSGQRVELAQINGKQADEAYTITLAREMDS